MIISVLKILGIVYVVVAVLTTISTFFTLNKAGRILSETRSDVYKATKLAKYCELPIYIRLFESFIEIGWIPILHIGFLIGLIFDNDGVCLRLITDFINQYERRLSES